MTTASDRIKRIEQGVYELARDVNVSDRQLERIDEAMETLFAILDLDIERPGTLSGESTP